MAKAYTKAYQPKVIDLFYTPLIVDDVFIEDVQAHVKHTQIDVTSFGDSESKFIPGLATERIEVNIVCYNPVAFEQLSALLIGGATANAIPPSPEDIIEQKERSVKLID